MAGTTTYQRRRSQIETYFDDTALKAWQQLTSDAPVSRIRATVRAGRARMQGILQGWLPEDIGDARIFDAGCGTGSLSMDLARRGAHVVAADLSPRLLGFARQRLYAAGVHGVEFHAGDMLELAESEGPFDYIVAMDSLIHYSADDMVAAIERLAATTRSGLHFSFAPRTPALTVMHVVGRLIPHREHRAPAIVPIAERTLRERLAASSLTVGRTERVSSGFYTSQALEVTHR